MTARHRQPLTPEQQAANRAVLAAAVYRHPDHTHRKADR